MLERFPINPRRDTLVPDIELYQMDLSGAVAQAIAANELEDEEMKLLPSWGKFTAHPVKSQGFFVRTLEAVFLGKHGLDSLNADLQTQQWTGRVKPRVAMMFVPANTRQEALEAIGNIARQALPAYRIVCLGGSITIDGVRCRNANAELLVREQVEKAHKLRQSTLVISAQLAQRSFSIPEITELYLAYDAGAAGATIQKMSRVLTPGVQDKVGRIISLSFDPNRDDKFDTMVLETALNLRGRSEKKSVVEAMKTVLKTINIFSCTEQGAVRVSIDTYLEQIMERKCISRVIGKVADLGLLTMDEIKALASGNNDYFRVDQVEPTVRGRIRDSQPRERVEPTEKADKSTEMLMARVREVITTIVENMDVIVYGTGCPTLEGSMMMIGGDPGMRAAMQEEFGVGFDTVQYLITSGVIRQEWLELLYDART